MLLSGMRSFVQKRLPDAGFLVGDARKVLLSYADNFKLVCKTELELHSTVEVI